MVEVNHMYAYTKKMQWKKKTIVILSLCVVGLGGYALTLPKQKESVPVFQSQTTLPLIELPTISKTYQVPFRIPAKQVSAFFDGSKKELDAIVEFEGVYRPNQGIDFSYENQEFDIYPISNGKVLKVYEDHLLGSCISVQHEDYIVTYGSLSNIKVKSGDQIQPQQKIAQAGKNTYRRDLGNHLYLTMEKDQLLIDPNTLIKQE